MLPICYKCATYVLQICYICNVLTICHIKTTYMLQKCYLYATYVLPMCYTSATYMLPICYTLPIWYVYVISIGFDILPMSHLRATYNQHNTTGPRGDRIYCRKDARHVYTYITVAIIRRKAVLLCTQCGGCCEWWSLVIHLYCWFFANVVFEFKLFAKLILSTNKRRASVIGGNLAVCLWNRNPTLPVASAAALHLQNQRLSAFAEWHLACIRGLQDCCSRDNRWPRNTQRGCHSPGHPRW